MEGVQVLAMPEEVAAFLRTSTARLAQLRYKGGGPRFVRTGAESSIDGPTSMRGLMNRFM